jgi:hypothetical protein
MIPSHATRIRGEVGGTAALAARAQLSGTQVATGGCLEDLVARCSSRFSPSGSGCAESPPLEDSGGAGQCGR